MAQPISNLPIPDLDDKTFEELVEEARARIPQYAPKWTDHNLSDPGITFLELFAWLAEMQIYSLNQLPDRNYLKFLKLLNEKPQPATPAKVDVTFTASKNGSVTIPKDTQVIARESATGEEIVFETDAAVEVLPVNLAKIVSFVDLKYTDHTDANNRVGVFYHAFGEKAQAGSIFYLGFNLDLEKVSGKEMTITVYLYETDLPLRGQHGQESPQIFPSAELVWEYWHEEEETKKWVTLELKKDDTIVLTKNGRISFVIPSDITRQILPPFLEEEYNLFWVRCKIVKEGYEIPPRIDTIKLNTISATQGQTVKDEILTRKDEETFKPIFDKTISSGLSYQVFQSKNYPIIAGIQALTVQGPNGDSNIWEERDDFDASGPGDNHYILHLTEGEIEFGDGVNGCIPPKGSEIKLTYRFGGGEIGNINAKTIYRACDEAGNPIQIEVENELQASGGKEEESLEVAQAQVRKDLKIPYRAVTAEDYKSIAKDTPGLRVARAYAAPYPEENLVKVAVVPYSLLERPTPSQGFLNTVCRHLDKHRLLTTNLNVIPPEYVQVSVDAEVRIKPQNEPEAMQEKIETALKNFLHPLTGGPDGDGWPFGRSVYQSEIYAVIEGVTGVDCVTRLALRAAGNYKYKDGNIDILPLSLVYSGTHNIEIRVPETVCKTIRR
ncbi:putative baseplate assembly protein [Candidatus Poribacteria bacterium]|nr:putative baseplate assembly protein [Candidatus Poribacteria bacterium]